MRGSGLRTPATDDSTKASKCARSTPVPSPSATQLLVTAAARRPRARMRRIASSIAGRGALLLEGRVERLEEDLAALEARPRARCAGRHHDAVQEPGGDAPRRLV